MMDDASRKERLSAARKKLREYQQKKKTVSPSPDNSSPETPPLSRETPNDGSVRRTPPTVETNEYSALPTAAALFSASGDGSANGSVFDGVAAAAAEFVGGGGAPPPGDNNEASSFVESFRRVSNGGGGGTGAVTPGASNGTSTPSPGRATTNFTIGGEVIARTMERRDAAEAEISAHASTIRLLVNERSELEAALSSARGELRLKEAETSEALNRVSWYQNRLAELESDAARFRSDSAQLQLQVRSLAAAADAKPKLERLVEEQQTEIAELGGRLNAKLNELDEARRHGQDMEAKLRLAELRLAGSETAGAGAAWWEAEKEKLVAEKAAVEAELVKRAVVAKAAAEEEWAGIVDEWRHKADETLKALNSSEAKVLELETKLREAEEARLAKEAEDEESRLLEEQKRVESVEEGAAAQVAVVAQCNHADYDALAADHARLRNLVASLELELEDARRLVSDSQQVAAAAASDQLAASRALAQNRAMKKQLDELQDAFVKMSHSKMSAAEEAAAEKHRNSELSAKVGELEEEVKGLRAELIVEAKNLETARKELLGKEGIEDRLQHYHAQHRHLSQGLELQLAEAKTTIEELRQERNELREELADLRTKSLVNGAVEPENPSSSIDALMRKMLEVETEKAVLADKLAKVEQQSKKEELVQGLSSELEAKFKMLMDDYANVCDQKQQLEHLCTQLQGETDTIGEYVALYRVQRSLLLRQAEEKEAELHKLNRDREAMRSKLAKLETLLVRQLKQSKAASGGRGRRASAEDGALAAVHSRKGDSGGGGDEEESDEDEGVGTKIMAVLSEVKESDLIAEQTFETCYGEAFHPCVCCSGKLITV